MVAGDPAEWPHVVTGDPAEWPQVVVSHRRVAPSGGCPARQATTSGHSRRERGRCGRRPVPEVKVGVLGGPPAGSLSVRCRSRGAGQPARQVALRGGVVTAVAAGGDVTVRPDQQHGSAAHSQPSSGDTARID